MKSDPDEHKCLRALGRRVRENSYGPILRAPAGSHNAAGAIVSRPGPDRVAAAETNGPLPEIYTLGADVMYEAIYDADGVLEAARRWRDPALVSRCQQFIESLYRDGEPLDEFFARVVAPLEPPAPA